MSRATRWLVAGGLAAGGAVLLGGAAHRAGHRLLAHHNEMFTGPGSHIYARLAPWLAGGLVLVLLSMLLIIGGSLRIRWVTQFRAPPGGGDAELVAQILCYRDRKTRLFFAELCLLLGGLAA